MSWFAEYLSQIRSGQIIVGRELMTELERLEKDLDDPRYRYDTSDAEKRIMFIERECKHYEAPWAGKPFPRAYAGAIRLLGKSHKSLNVDAVTQSAAVLAAGDQLFTDVLGAHWYNFPAAWLRPITRNDFIGTKVLRLLEKWVAWYLTKKEILPEEDKDI